MEPNNTNNTSGIKQKLFTVTPLSKLVALILFIALPFIGFWLGRQYPVPPAQIVDETAEVSETQSETEAEADTETTKTDTQTNTNNARTNTVTPTPTPVPTPSVQTGPAVNTVYIKEITLDSISVDNIAIYEGNSAVQQMIADGLCTASEPQKCTLTAGQYYRNTDPTVYTYPIANNVVVQTWTGGDYALSKLVNRTQAEAPYEITVTNGVVTKIKEVYRP